MYNNVGKRDILIFPKFKNIELIQNIRDKHDKLAHLVAPHITLAFPFSDNMSNDELIGQLSNLLKSYTTFSVTFQNISLSDDNYIFLSCTSGKEKLIKLHDEIYKNILPNHLNKSIEYIPHITLGKSKITNEFKDFNYKFTTLINEISVELIGENEKSIILRSIKLKDNPSK